MSVSTITWLPTAAFLLAVAAIYVGFVVSARFMKAGKRRLAVTVPAWLFAPIALLADRLFQGSTSVESALVLCGFSLALCFVTWLHVRGEP